MSALGGLGRTVRAGVAGLALALLPLALAGQEIRYSGSLGYATGDYIFTEPTASASLLTGLSARWGRFLTYASVPVLMQNSSAVTYLHGVLLPTGGPASGAVGRRQPGEPVRMGRRHAANEPIPDTVLVTEPGTFRVRLGDPVLTGSFEAYQGFSLLRSVELRAQVKAPLTDVDGGVGSGAWDWGAGSSVALGSGRTLLFLDATYWWLGDMPDLELVDYLDYGLGLGIAVGERWTALASFAGATRVIDNVDPPASLALSVARHLTERASVSAGVGFGLTESTADVSVFLGWSFRLRSERPAS